METIFKSEESLSYKRFKESLKRKYKLNLSTESESEPPEDMGDAEEESITPIYDDETPEDTARSSERYFGKDVVIKPLAYYTIQDSLNHALNDYVEQVAKVTREIEIKRVKYGQRLATIKDREDALGEYPERYEEEDIKIPVSVVGMKLKRHYFTRPIKNYLYRITIDEAPVGILSNKRNTYMLVDMAVIFYRKNQVGLGKEIVIRSKVLRFRKRAPHPNEEKK
jgi:hypothetical protein